MRFKSKVTDGYQVFAVSGTNTVSFAVDAAAADTKDLLGFAVERFDPQANERYFMPGFKVFRSVIPAPDETTTVSTNEHPIQSFVWDDFTAKPKHKYEYAFQPLHGQPKNLDRSRRRVEIAVKTEPAFSDLAHDVFFNRGVASSQAYERRFGNKAPDQQDTPQKEKEALQWLSRDLDEALLKFIKNAKKNDTLLGCFYEFRYLPVAQELKKALNRGVKVRLVIDAKENAKKDKNGVLQSPFPREANLETLKKAKIPLKTVTFLREARAANIQHNKFLVLLKGKTEKPVEVWTGSTNISMGGVHGQTNVGHWVRDEDTAAAFLGYWNLLKTDPGAVKGDDKSTTLAKNKAYRTAVEQLDQVPTTLDKIPDGITAIFSPRGGGKVLEMYAALVDKAEELSCITLAFGISDVFKAQISDNTKQDHLAFFLLEKRDKPNPKSKKEFVALNAKNNVYKAWGSFLRNPLHQWAKETSARALGLNTHVSFIHSKFLLRDPLGLDPIVVTGSANFSKASTNDNDENMIIIRGDQRVADIYFTEFNRLFFHYYFRSVQEATFKPGVTPKPGSAGDLFLSENDDWLGKYKPGSLRQKRVDVLARMKGV
ncbi:MAG: hypothetical protein C0484_01555 [Rhodospirillum sp.]|nr:hypothetical protein [Rhodospirillum sp.]